MEVKQLNLHIERCTCSLVYAMGIFLISSFSFILQHVIRGNRPIKTEMAHQLYVLQVLTFNLLEERMMTKMDPNDQVTIRAK